MGIHVGNINNIPDSFKILNKNKFLCRAIDNRAGGFDFPSSSLIFENKIKLPFGLYYQFSARRSRFKGCEMIYSKNKT